METLQKIKKVLVIGAGPENIGRGAELHSALWQACCVFREAGLKVVVVDNNPASLATDYGRMERTYLEPLSIITLEQIVAKEQPDALFAACGGRTASDLVARLAERGVLQKYRLTVLGATPAALYIADELTTLRSGLHFDALTNPSSAVVETLKEGIDQALKIGLPVAIRPVAVVAGMGATLVYNQEELPGAINRALELSPVKQTLVEVSLQGWREYETVFLRDHTGAMVEIATVEALEPIGIHWGDSTKTLPAQSVSPREQKWLASVAGAVLEKLEVIGGACLRWACNPANRQWALINVNLRYTANCALAAAATGCPAAQLWAKLVLGCRLNELFTADWLQRGQILGRDANYQAVVLPHFDFEKFPAAEQRLSLMMSSLGESLTLGANFKEALQKGLRSIGREYFDGKSMNGDVAGAAITDREIRLNLIAPGPRFLYYLRLALRRGMKPQEVARLGRVDPWFVEQMAELVALEKELTTYALYNLPVAILRKAKEWGFTDQQLAGYLRVSATAIRQVRQKEGIMAAGVGVLPQEAARSSKMRFLSYQASKNGESVADSTTVLVLGSGPCRLGEGLGLDHCAAVAAETLIKAGYQPVMLNCNLRVAALHENFYSEVYLEPLDEETVLTMVELLGCNGVIAQFAGRLKLDLVEALEQAGLLKGEAATFSDSERRFSRRSKELAACLGLELAQPEQLRGATGLVAEVIGDGTDAVLSGIVEQIEEAWVNLSDSACSFPSYSVAREVVDRVAEYALRLVRELGRTGLFQLRFAIRQERIAMIEVIPGASELTLLIGKTTVTDWVEVAIRAIMGETLSCRKLPCKNPLRHSAVKEAVFPFERFPAVDPILGNTVRSTGAVLGMAQDFGMAFIKAQLAAGQQMPTSGIVFLNIHLPEVRSFLPVVRQMIDLGFELAAFEEIALVLNSQGNHCQVVNQLGGGRPDILDWIKNEKVQWLISLAAGFEMEPNETKVRSAAVKRGIPITTTLSGTLAAIGGMRQYMAAGQVAKALQDYSSFSEHLKLLKE